MSTSLVAGNCSVDLLRAVSLSFAAAVQFYGIAKCSRASRAPPHNVGEFNDISGATMAENRVLIENEAGFLPDHSCHIAGLNKAEETRAYQSNYQSPKHSYLVNYAIDFIPPAILEKSLLKSLSCLPIESREKRESILTSKLCQRCVETFDKFCPSFIESAPMGVKPSKTQIADEVRTHATMFRALCKRIYEE